MLWENGKLILKNLDDVGHVSNNVILFIQDGQNCSKHFQWVSGPSEAASVSSKTFDNDPRQPYGQTLSSEGLPTALLYRHGQTKYCLLRDHPKAGAVGKRLLPYREQILFHDSPDSTDLP